LAAKYAAWLVALGIDGVELSCGTVMPAPWSTIRGNVPVDEMARAFPWWQRPVARMVIGQSVGKFDLVEAYNLQAAQEVRPALGSVPMAVVGGMRTLSRMEEIVGQGQADQISLCRPFIREPNLVKKFREGKADEAACQSCNLCIAALQSDRVVRCYCKGIPS
jgi:2,4-dienoyl-CoA reductase-like NADH-dependent reductase (Old Yellow Enzyme family)